jgi:DNA-directed RNA polymerase omega subunit
MAYIPLEKLLRSTTSGLYQLVMGAAKRCTELSQGQEPLIQTPSKKIATIALEEIAENKVKIDWDYERRDREAAAAKKNEEA